MHRDSDIIHLFCEFFRQFHFRRRIAAYEEGQIQIQCVLTRFILCQSVAVVVIHADLSQFLAAGTQVIGQVIIEGLVVQGACRTDRGAGFQRVALQERLYHIFPVKGSAECVCELMILETGIAHIEDHKMQICRVIAACGDGTAKAKASGVAGVVDHQIHRRVIKLGNIIIHGFVCLQIDLLHRKVFGILIEIIGDQNLAVIAEHIRSGTHRIAVIKSLALNDRHFQQSRKTVIFLFQFYDHQSVFIGIDTGYPSGQPAFEPIADRNIQRIGHIVCGHFVSVAEIVSVIYRQTPVLTIFRVPLLHDCRLNLHTVIDIDDIFIHQSADHLIVGILCRHGIQRGVSVIEE